MELNNLTSPCDGCNSNPSYKSQCTMMKECKKYREWLAEVMDEIFKAFFGKGDMMKKCATCKYGVFVQIWGEWKCRKFEKHCYNNDLYYLECKEYVRKGKEEEKDD